MPKKAATTCLGLLVFLAFAVPSFASADTLKSGGSAVAVGSSVTGSLSGEASFQVGGTALQCTGLKMKGTVVKNNGELVEVNTEEWKYTGPASEGRCNSGSPLLGSVAISLDGVNCLRKSVGFVDWKLRGAACTVASKALGMTWSYSSGVTCHYQRTTATGPVSLTSNINSEPLQLSMSGSSTTFVLKEKEPVGCYTSYTMQQVVELKTGAGAGLELAV
jgi:hypothetical protein